MAKQVGGSPLSWKGVVDFNEAYASTDKFFAYMADLNKKNPLFGGASDAATGANRQAQLQVQEAIRNTRLETAELKKEQQEINNAYAQARANSAQYKAAVDELKISQQDLKNQYEQGKLTAQEYALSQKRIEDNLKNATKAELDAIRIEKEKEALVRSSLATERAREQQAARNKRQLERESSEYYKLNQALRNVRNEAKDVAAEMFRLENQGGKNTAAYARLKTESERLTRQTNFLDSGIKKIDASLGLHQRNVGNYQQAIGLISPQLARIQFGLQAMGVSLEDIGKKGNGFQSLVTGIKNVGSAIGSFLLSPVGLAVTAIAGLFALIRGNASTVVQFDSALFNVSKTTGIAGAELNRLGDSLVRLSRELKVVDAQTLAEYATVAGQLGVKGTQNILAFSEALAKLETASNISGEEGAANIARLLTLTDGGVQNVSRFGDEIVNLGNNFAATEREILENATQIAQNTGLYKIGRTEVLAYATATKSVGIEAELVGSTFNRTLATFEKAIRTGKGLNTILQITGKSAEEIRTQFRDNASGVFNDFIRGLNAVDRDGRSVNAVLESIGISAVRDTRVISSLATNGYQVLSDALQVAADAAGALDAEFSTASQKLERQFSRIGTAWSNLVLSIENGQGVFGRAARTVADFFARTIENINRLTDATKSQSDFRLDTVDEFSAAPIRERLKWLNREETVYNDMIKSRREGQKVDEEAIKNQKLLVDDLRLAYKRVKDEENRSTNAFNVEGDIESKEDAKAKRAAEAAERRAAQAIQRQRDLQGQIADINNRATRSQLSNDEQQRQSVIDKYAAIRRAIEKFYADTRNSGLRVDTSGLDRSMNLELADVEAKRVIDLEKRVIQERKAAFDEFERYKLEVGEQTARQAFRDQIGEFENYAAYLRSLRPPDTDRSVLANRRRDLINFDLLPAADKEREKRDQEQYRRSLVAAQSFAQQIAAVEARLQADLSNLRGRASDEQVAALERQAREQISAIQTAAIKEETQWEAVFGTISGLSDKATQEFLKQAESRIEVGRLERTLVKKDYVDMINQVRSAQTELNQRNPFIGLPNILGSYRKSLKEVREAQELLNKAIEEYGRLSSQAQSAQDKLNRAQEAAKLNLRELAGAVAEYAQGTTRVIGALGQSFETLGIGDERLSGMVERIGKLTTGVGELSAGIASKNPLQIVAGSINVLTSAIDLFNSKDRRLARSIANYERMLVGLQSQYRELGKAVENSIGTSVYEDSRRQIANLQQQNAVIQRQIDAESKKKKSDQETIIGYQDRMQQNLDEIDRINQSITDNLLQTDYKSLSNTLANALVSAFEQGEDGIKALNRSFDEFIRNAVVNSLRLRILEPLIADVTDQVAKYLDANQGLEGFDFTRIRQQLNQAGGEFSRNLETILAGLGVDLREEAAQQDRGLAGQVRASLTEETAGKWLGAQLNINSNMTKVAIESARQTELQRGCLAIATRSVQHEAAIERNTLETVNQLRIVVERLDTIGTNTRPQYDISRDRGF